MTTCRTTAAAVAALGLLSGALPSRPAAAQGAGLALELHHVVGGLARPLGIADPADGSDRLFLVEQGGRILIWNGSALLGTPFLDLGARISCCNERGLLGLAFHPDYPSNGLFYVSYTDTANDTVISRFSVSESPDVADPGSELILLTQSQPASNHNNGHLAFGPDGFLYIGMGDGGPGADPDDRGQDLGSLLGKILRIDVDAPEPPLPYGIPDDNPFVTDPGARDEIWAYGLRNPWRFGFDRETGDLMLGDVGQGALEEIDHQSAASSGGENYGWSLMEGSSCFDPPSGCDDGTLTLPVLEYDHSFGCAVTGGFRYRGHQHPRLGGVYLYGDFCSGVIWGTVPRCDGAWESTPLLDTALRISSFGEDAAGELYVVDLQESDGGIYRVGLAAGSGGPALEPTPSELDFGPVEVDAAAGLELSLLNANGGAEALTIAGLATSDPVRFTLDLEAGAFPCGTPPICLGPSESCTLEVTFASGSAGAFAAQLELDGNFDPLAVPLAALAYEPCGFPVTAELTDVVIDEPIQVSACAEVLAGPDVVVVAGGEAVLTAGARVTFRDGFRVDAGGGVRAEVDPTLLPD